MLRKIIVYVSLFMLLGVTSSYSQTPVSDTLRYLDKIPHWLGAYQLTAHDYLQGPRNQFKSSAFIESYVEAVLDHPAWMFTMLNQFTALRSTQARNTPHIVFNIRFKPMNEQFTNYQVSLAVLGSPDLKLNFNGITQAANFMGLNGRTFTSPQDAHDEVAQAIQEAMRLISRDVGRSLAPNLMVKFKNEVFWNGHEILIGKEGDNQVTLQPVAKSGRTLTSEQVRWTNAMGGIVDMAGQRSKIVTLTHLDTAASLTVTVKRRTSFALDVKSILAPIVLQVLQEKLTLILDSLVNIRVDSAANANLVSDLIGQLEADNVALEPGGSLVPLFSEPIVLSDSSAFTETTLKGRALRELKKRKRLQTVLRTKVNVAAFLDLLIRQPDKLDELVDDLLLNSGTLLGELVLNIGDPNVLQTSRNIIITYVNRNLTRVAGSYFGMAPDEPITVRTVPAKRFDPAVRLYMSTNVDFPGKEEFKAEMTGYLNTLDPPLYVFINYSQDISTASFMTRATNARPSGLPADAKFMTFTLLNIPGSVKEQLLVGGAGQRDLSAGGKSSKEVIWDLVRNGPSPYYTNEELIAFLKTVRKNNEKFIGQTDPQAKAYMSLQVVTEQDLKDQKIIDYMSNLSLYKFLPNYKATDQTIQGWLTMISDDNDGEWGKLIQAQPSPMPYDQNPILLAREVDVETDTKEKFKISMNGYSLSNLSITLYAHESTVGNDVKLTFFNGLIAPSGEVNSADEKNTTNIRKAFDITVHSKNVEAFKTYLKLRGTINIVAENPNADEIIIDVVRKRSNKYITVSELSIRGTNIKGAALELGKGTDEESKATCTEVRSDCYECKRILPGEYPFEVNSGGGTQGQHKFKTLRLLDTNKNGSNRTGILIHMGDGISWTQGCLLAMYENEIDAIIHDDSKISSLMGYGVHIDERNAGRVFILSLIEFIEEKEEKIGKNLIKKVIIRDDPQEGILNVSTKYFELLQKCNQLYYSNKLFTAAVNRYIEYAKNLQSNIFQEKLMAELTKHTENLIVAISKDVYNPKEAEAAYDTIWDQLLEKYKMNLSLTAIQTELVLKKGEYQIQLKGDLLKILSDINIVNEFFTKNGKTLLHKNVFDCFETIKGKDGKQKIGFMAQYFDQKLYDETLSAIESSIKASQIRALEKAINKD